MEVEAGLAEVEGAEEVGGGSGKNAAKVGNPRRGIRLCLTRISAVSQFEREHALSVPKSAGRRDLYKSVTRWSEWFGRGRPF